MVVGLVEVFLVFSQDSIFLWQIVDNPVTWQGVGGGLQGLHWTEFNSVFGADRRVPRSRWRSSRFSTSAELRSVFFGFSWTRWARVFSDFSPGQKSPESAGQVDEKMPRNVSSSTPAACEVHHVVRDDLWVQVVTDDDLYFWHRQEQTAHMSACRQALAQAWVRSQ